VSEQCFTSPPTQYRLYGRRFLQVKRPNQQYQSALHSQYTARLTTPRVWLTLASTTQALWPVFGNHWIYQLQTAETESAPKANVGRKCGFIHIRRRNLVDL